MHESENIAMIKLFKRVAWVLLFVVLLLLLLVGSALIFVDPNDYKGHISRLVEARTGRTLTIQENFSLSFFPWLGVRLGKMVLGNAPGFGPQPFARIGSAEVRIKLLPLLQRKMEIGTLILRNFHLNFERNQAGTTNWADLSRSTRGTPSPLDEAPASSVSDVGPGQDHGRGAPVTPAHTALLTRFSLAGVELSHGSVSWWDGRSPEPQTLHDLTLTIGHLSEKRPIPLTLRCSIKQQGSQALELTFIGEMIADLEKQRVSLKSDQTSLVKRGAGLPSEAASMRAAFILEANLLKETLRLSELTLMGLGVTITGQVEGEEILSTPRFTGHVSTTTFSPRAVWRALGNPPLRTRDPQAWQSARLVMAGKADEHGATLDDVTISVDDTRAQGTLTIRDFATMAVRWHVSIDTLNLDRYRAPLSTAPSVKPASLADTPSPSSSPPSRKEAATPVSSSHAMPLAEPQTASAMDGQLDVKQLKVAHVTMQDMTAQITAQQGVLRVTSAQAALYQGRWSTTGTIDASARAQERGVTPRIALNSQWKGVQIGPLLRDLHGRSEIDGTLTLTAKLATMGEEVSALKRHLEGAVTFEFQKGTLRGINIPKMIEDAQTLLEGRTPKAVNAPEVTEFTRLTGTADIARGMVKNRDLVLTSPLFDMRGAGQINLPDDHIDYRIQASVAKAWQGQGGRTLEQLADLIIPIQVSGSTSRPAWRLDIDDLLKQKLAQKARAKLNDTITEQIKKQGLEKLVPEALKKRLLEVLPF